MDDVFEFVDRPFGAAVAESEYQDRAVVGQGLFDDAFQALPASAPVFVQAIAAGAFDHQDVTAVRRLGRWQQGRMRRAEFTGEYDEFFSPVSG